jgi:hypothetical protein
MFFVLLPLFQRASSIAAVSTRFLYCRCFNALPLLPLFQRAAAVSARCRCFSELPLFQRASSTAAVSARDNKT